MITIALTAAATAKWLTISKILTTVGGACITIAPMIDKSRRQSGSQNKAV